MNKTSEQRLSTVHPELAKRARIIAARLAQKGIVVEVTQGLRSYAEQNELFKIGRTIRTNERPVTNARAGQSFHNFGMAVDFVITENGKPNWNAPRAQWLQIAEAAEALGLESGARWKFVDLPHVQLHGLSVAQCRALYERGGLPLVWQRASAVLGVVEAPLPKPKPAPKPQPAPTTPQIPPFVVRVPENLSIPPAPTGAATEAARTSPPLPPAPLTATKAAAGAGVVATVVGVLVAFWEWALVNHRAILLVVLVVDLSVLGWVSWKERRQKR